MGQGLVRDRMAASVDAVRNKADFPFERAKVAILERGVEQSAIEVAVVADGRAERNVNVKAEGLRIQDMC